MLVTTEVLELDFNFFESLSLPPAVRPSLPLSLACKSRTRASHTCPIGHVPTKLTSTTSMHKKKALRLQMIVEPRPLMKDERAAVWVGSKCRSRQRCNHIQHRHARLTKWPPPCACGILCGGHPSCGGVTPCHSVRFARPCYPLTGQVTI